MILIVLPLQLQVINSCHPVDIRGDSGGTLKRKGTKRVVDDENGKNDALGRLRNNKLDPAAVAAPVASD